MNAAASVPCQRLSTYGVLTNAAQSLTFGTAEFLDQACKAAGREIVLLTKLIMKF